jgi:hypothetical protein
LEADLSYEFGGKKFVSDEAKAIIRDTDGKQVGTVGKGYTPISYMDSFDKVFPHVLSMGGVPCRALQFKDGRFGSIQFILPTDNNDVAGKKHQLWLTLGNSFDGTMKLKAGGTDITIVCMNTFKMAMSAMQTGVKHSKLMDGSLSKLTQEIRGIYKDFDVFILKQNKLADEKITIDQVDLFSKVLFPITSYNNDGSPNKAAINNRKNLVMAYADEQANYQDTKLTLFNAVTRMIDHSIDSTESDADAWAYATGAGQKVKDQGLEILNWPIPQWNQVYKESTEYTKTPQFVTV